MNQFTLPSALIPSALIPSALIIVSTSLGLLTVQPQRSLAQNMPAVNRQEGPISTVDQHQKQKLGNSQSIGTIEAGPAQKPEAQAAIVLPVKTIERPSAQPTIAERVLPNLADGAVAQPAGLNQELFDRQLGPGFGLIRTDL
jgi:hypothetical protein